MTKTPEEIELMAEAGRLLASVFTHLDGLPLTGMTTLEVNDRVEVYGYVNNLLDERSAVLLEPARGNVVFTQGSMTSPRMVGIGIRGTF